MGLELEKILSENIKKSNLSDLDKLNCFARFAGRRYIAQFLNRYEIFKNILNIQGSVIEGGVNLGQGFFSWLHFSSILEPYNSNRKIIGFDSFDGFTNIKEQDRNGNYEDNENWKTFREKQSYEEIVTSLEAQNNDRPLNFINKMEIIKGDVSVTIPSFIQNNPHLIIALLHLDFDVYEPTRVALEHFLPRVPVGGAVVFDELNDGNAPGETIAMLEKNGLGLGKLRRNTFDSNISYIIRER